MTMGNVINESVNINKCSRCGVECVMLMCVKCKRELEDEEYLDEGSMGEVDEQKDRDNSGEYADLNEGDEILNEGDEIL